MLSLSEGTVVCIALGHSQAGVSFGLIEEHETAGQPVHCTGIITPDAFREFNIPRDAILNELRTVRFFSPSGQQFQHSPPAVEAVVIDRARFDYRLYRWPRKPASRCF